MSMDPINSKVELANGIARALVDNKAVFECLDIDTEDWLVTCRFYDIRDAILEALRSNPK